MPFSTVAIWRNQWGSGGDWGNQSCWKYGVQQWRTELPACHSHTGPYWQIRLCVFEGAGEPASILGPLTLTLLPFSVTTSLLACFPNNYFNPCHFLFSFFRFYTLQKHPYMATPTSTPLWVFPVIIMLKVELSPTRSSLSLLRRPAVCAFTCFVIFISFPTRSAVASASSALSSVHNCRRVGKQLLVCVHVRRCDGGMNRGLVRSVPVRKMLVFIVTDTHALQKTALCVCIGVCLCVA